MFIVWLLVFDFDFDFDLLLFFFAVLFCFVLFCFVLFCFLILGLLHTTPFSFLSNLTEGGLYE